MPPSEEIPPPEARDPGRGTRRRWGAAAVAVLLVLSGAVPAIGTRVLQNVIAGADLLLLLGSAGVLLWFIYRVYLRRVWRARHIANIRLKRILQERANGRADGPD